MVPRKCHKTSKSYNDTLICKTCFTITLIEYSFTVFPFKEEIAPPVDSEPRTKNMALPANQATGKDYVVS